VKSSGTSAAAFSASLAVCLLASYAQTERGDTAQQVVQTSDPVARMVLAFYYPWYGNPKVAGGSGRLFHWDRFDEEQRQIVSSTQYPSLGPYDSHDRKLIAQHCRWAKQANVHGFIVSWWGQGTFEDQALSRILDGCKEAGLKATIYYETVSKPQKEDSAIKDVLWLLEKYAGHPAWLRVQGKPVLFVYGRALDEIGLDAWKSVIAEVNGQHEPGAIFIGDRLDAAAARVFHGIHTYNPAGSLQAKSLEQVRQWAKQNYAASVATAKTHQRISTITLIPGYDDTKIRKPGLRVERMNGDSYRTQWQEAIAADPHWVLITSWNEWHEGSEIEPSVEFGDQYLRLTSELSARFQATK
jgi:hypothetical protein